MNTPVDLLLLFSREKDLSKAARVDLTGITPTETASVPLKGEPYVWNDSDVALPVKDKGVYLVVAKADELDASQPDLPMDLGRHSLLVLNGKQHLRDRKLMTPSLHGERLRGYSETSSFTLEVLPL